MSVRDPRDVLLAPVISEKSYGLLDENQYTFIVLPEANKTQIKIAVEQIFNVKVAQRQHDQPPGQAQAQPGQRLGQAQGHQARDRLASPPATASRSSGARAPDGTRTQRTRDRDRD